MYVCMSVRNGFTTEVYEITYGLRTLRHVPLGALELTVKNLEERRRRQTRDTIQKTKL